MILVRLLLPLWLVLQLLSTTALAQAERVVRVGVYNFAPVIFVDQEGMPRGIFIDVLEHVAAKERWKLEYVKGTWAECLERLQRGEIDLQPSIGFTEERARSLNFNQEALFLDWGVVYRQKGKPLDTLLDLDGKTIAALKGSVYTEGLRRTLDQFAIKATIIEKGEYTEVLKSLDSREVDAGVITKVYGLSIEGKYPNSEATTVYFSPLKLLFATPKLSATDLLDTLDRHFAELKADRDSIYHQSHSKWMNSELKRTVLPPWLPWLALGGVVLITFLYVSRQVLRRKVAEQTVELRRAMRGIENERHRFMDLVQSANGIVWEADAVSRNFIFVSDQAERILGYPLADWFKPGFFNDHINPEDRQRIDSQIAECLQRQTPAVIEYRLKANDGHDVWLQDNLTVTIENSGEHKLLRGLMVNITRSKEVESELQRLNRELDQRVQIRTEELELANQNLSDVNKELESFSYSISHDLRVPLRAIDGFSHMLLKRCDSSLDAEGKRLLAVVRENSARMAQLIDDILEFSRTGRQEIRKVECDIRSIIVGLWADFAPTLQNRTVELRLGVLPRAWADPTLLRQALQNLLANAVKFTRDTKDPYVEVGSRQAGEELVYFVKDNGAGFDQQYVGKLFGVFQRLHGVEEFEGTGVGLAIVRSVINRHGGRVWADGKVGDGATLSFTLPIKEK